jgi:hypothetical protein
MKRAVSLFASALLVSALPWAYGQAGNPADLQQALNSSFRITTMAANHTDIATAGDVVELHKDGLRMSALSTILTESNTYKDGKIGGGGAKRAWGSLGTAMLQASAAMDTTGETEAPATGPPPRILAAGERCWVLSITVQKDGVAFKLLTDPDDNNIRYHADLKFPFPNKKEAPTTDAMLSTIAEVLSVVSMEQSSAEPAPNAVAPPPPRPTQDNNIAPPSLPPGEIHGAVTGPEGVLRTSGSVSLSTDGGQTNQYIFTVSSNGSYEGQAAPGTYTVLYHEATTPPNQFIDSITGVQILSGQSTAQNIDMTRSEFINKLSPENRRALEDLKARNAAAIQKNEVIKALNADLRICTQDLKDADSAPDAETKAAKYGEAETLLLKDTQMKPDASILWAELGRAQVGLMKFADAESSFMRALELENRSSRPNAQIQSLANTELGKIHARIGNAAGPDAASAAAPPPPPPQRQYDTLAPPPAPAPTITIGELKTQVLSDFGEPQRKALNGPKEIYFYTDLKMKVTFIDGKVSSID